MMFLAVTLVEKAASVKKLAGHSLRGPRGRTGECNSAVTKVIEY